MRRPARLLGIFIAIIGACDRQESVAPRTTEKLAWRTLAEAPTARTEVTAAVLGGKIYVAGGFIEGGETVAAVEVYDTAGGSWEEGPDLPLPTNHAMSASDGNQVYVIGGYAGPGLTVPTSRGFVLEGGAWVEIPSMPEPRAAAAAAFAGGKVFVVGGVGATGHVAEMLVFDVSSRIWERAPGPSVLRDHLGVAAYRGRVYALGGRSGQNFDDAEVLEVGTGKWSKIPSMPTARGGVAAAATANGFVIVAGGEAEDTFDEAEAFDVESGSWVSLPKMPTARHGLGVAAVGEVLYVIAGGPKPGFAFSGANEAIDLSPLR